MKYAIAALCVVLFFPSYDLFSPFGLRLLS